MTMVPSQNTPLVFTFPETAQQVRSVTINGEPWFVGRDATAILGYRTTNDGTRWLDDDEKGTHWVRTPGGDQEMVIVSEPGLYSLIIRSKRDEANAFRRWITHDVIPSIRRTGSYSTTPVLPDLTTPAGVLALAEQFAATARQLVEADGKIRELEPKALVHDTLMAAQEGDRLVRQAAKELGWRESDLRGFLLDEHLVYRRQRTCGGWEYDFYAAHADCFNSVEKVVEHTWGKCAHYTLHITPRGLSFVQMRIGKRRSELTAAIEGGAR